MQIYNNELYHYGVLGMKWRQRRRVDEAIKRSRRDLETTMNDYQKAKQEYMNSNSTSKAKKYRDSEKKYMETQALAFKRTTTEKASKIAGTAIAVIGGMTLSAYAASRK